MNPDPTACEKLELMVIAIRKKFREEDCTINAFAQLVSQAEKCLLYREHERSQFLKISNEKLEEVPPAL